jgi:hypothetical protein
MKEEINPGVAVGVGVVIVAILGALIYFFTAGRPMGTAETQRSRQSGAQMMQAQNAPRRQMMPVGAGGPGTMPGQPAAPGMMPGQPAMPGQPPR